MQPLNYLREQKHSEPNIRVRLSQQVLWPRKRLWSIVKVCAGNSEYVPRHMQSQRVDPVVAVVAPESKQIISCWIRCVASQLNPQERRTKEGNLFRRSYSAVCLWSQDFLRFCSCTESSQKDSANSFCQTKLYDLLKTLCDVTRGTVNTLYSAHFFNAVKNEWRSSLVGWHL